MPAGFPSGMPGIGLDMDGAIQHAPHFRQFIFFYKVSHNNVKKKLPFSGQFIKMFLINNSILLPEHSF